MGIFTTNHKVKDCSVVRFRTDIIITILCNLPGLPQFLSGVPQDYRILRQPSRLASISRRCTPELPTVPGAKVQRK